MKPRSMEEKISYRLFFMGFVGLVCTAVLCLFVFHKAFREQAWTSLEHQADLVSAGYEQLSSPDQLSVFVNGDLRITLIAADGSVVFESATDQQMENHLSRPEIQQAMREGVGRNCRDSQTMGYETYYYAMLLPGGDQMGLVFQRGPCLFPESLVEHEDAERSGTHQPRKAHQKQQIAYFFFHAAWFHCSSSSSLSVSL